MTHKYKGANVDPPKLSCATRNGDCGGSETLFSREKQGVTSGREAVEPRDREVVEPRNLETA